MLFKKVLLITYHFPPSAASGAFRLLGFAKHLPRAGWQPLVVAPPQLPWEPVDPQLAWQIPADAIVRSVPYPASAPKVVRYLAQYAVWLPSAWSACKQMIHEHHPDAILTSGPPHCVHLLGHYLKRKFGVPWVADFRDPWISDGSDKPLGLMQRFTRSWEQTVFAQADLVLANAPNACRMLQSVYPQQQSKIVTLTNGFDPRSSPSRYTATSDSCVRLLHAGELYAGRDPLPLMEAIAQANTDALNGAAFELNIVGRSETDLSQTMDERFASFVRLHGQQSYRDTLDAMDCADILILFDSPGRKNGVPAKLYEYFRAGRPILALAEPDGDVAAILRESGIMHRIASPRDAGQIRQALAELREEMIETDVVADPRRLRRFTREAIAGTLAGMLDSISGQASPQRPHHAAMGGILQRLAS
jgi:Glycosyltransferase Family 4/Glycosyl transferases group 1